MNSFFIEQKWLNTKWFLSVFVLQVPAESDENLSPHKEPILKIEESEEEDGNITSNAETREERLKYELRQMRTKYNESVFRLRAMESSTNNQFDLEHTINHLRQGFHLLAEEVVVRARK